MVFSCDKDFMGTMEKGFMGYTYDYRNNLTRVFDHAVYPASSLYMSYITRNHYGYDRRGLRMSSATEVLGNDRMFRTTYDYDGILRLKGKEHSIDGKKTSEQMRYNIQGWLTNKTSDAFDMELKYYDTYTAGGIKTYTGNISEWSFRHKGNESQQTTYMYDYDKLGRLVESYSNIGNNAFTEQGLSYDRNGNIQTLKRYGANGTLVDDFKYVTDGNQLYSLNGLLYGYDRNGNCIKDPRQGLDFTYNYLNLVETISKDETTQAKYIWLANGQKVATLNINGDGLIYKGNHVYRVENGRYTLESFSFEEGRVNKETDGSFTYNQHFTDHLGSVRAIAKNGTVQQDQYNYYPFGLSWSEPTTSNRYLYNGKETQRQFANDYLDYGARMYDPTIGRWHNLDPLLEKYFPFSPYAYVGNNPIRRVDIGGKSWWDKVQGTSRAILHNLTGIDTRSSYTPNDAGDYNSGQNLGDAISLVTAGAEIVAGGAAVAGGGAAAIATGGVSLTGVAVGAALGVHGSFMAAKATENLTQQKGRVSEASSLRTSKDALRQDKHGNKIPDPEAKGAKHTQLGTRKSKKGDYKQVREFDEKGNPVKDIDFTDHGRPNQHSNPHQHIYEQNNTGGTPKRSKENQPIK